MPIGAIFQRNRLRNIGSTSASAIATAAGAAMEYGLRSGRNYQALDQMRWLSRQTAQRTSTGRRFLHALFEAKPATAPILHLSLPGAGGWGQNCRCADLRRSVDGGQQRPPIAREPRNIDLVLVCTDLNRLQSVSVPFLPDNHCLLLDPHAWARLFPAEPRDQNGQPRFQLDWTDHLRVRLIGFISAQNLRAGRFDASWQPISPGDQINAPLTRDLLGGTGDFYDVAVRLDAMGALPLCRFRDHPGPCSEMKPVGIPT